MNMTKIFESHAHYDDEAFDQDREELLGKMQQQGIEYIINIGANIDSSKTTVDLTEKYPFLYGAVGVHPSDTAELDEQKIGWLKLQCERPKIVSVGEIGLDYYWDEPERPVQRKWFCRQLELAREVKLPVVIHSRDAAKDTLTIMKEMHAEEIGGVIHCFSYSKEMAEEYLKLGFYIGVGGVVTFNNAKKLKEAVEFLPMDKILLETDCPYLSPVPNRGKRNSSLNLPYIARQIAELKGISYEQVVEITNRNARKLFFRN